MTSLTELEKVKDRAFLKCQTTKEKMKMVVDSPTAFARLAQEANDAWLEYKDIETQFNNQIVLKQMGDLYGCV